ncbi:MAG: signal peptidase I [Candidatus Aenigmarchaeota archaeon]|nr:signal peptidase I [Candidatus Aenigmarchaeota archaeon]
MASEEKANAERKDKKHSAKRDVIEILAAFAVAWLFYQGLAFAVGTNLPIVSVVSDSMYHIGGSDASGIGSSFDHWWSGHGNFYEQLHITKQEFKKFTLPNGMSKGDLLLVTKPENLKVGDIILYSRDVTIVHRIISITNNGYVTKGDNNLVSDPEISRSQVVGKVIADVPALGYPRLLLFAVGI